MDERSKKQPLPSSVCILDAHGMNLNALYEHYNNEQPFTGIVKRYRPVGSDGEYVVDERSPLGMLSLRVLNFQNHLYDRLGFNTEVHLRILESAFTGHLPAPESILYLMRPGFDLTVRYNYRVQVGIVSHIETALKYPNQLEHSERAERNFIKSIALKIGNLFDR